MNTTGLIARRYLFSKKHISLISTLTIISITGVTIGTALLIVVLSVFNGFFDVIQGLLLMSDPDIRIESAEGNSITYQPEVFQEVESIPEVRIATPFAAGKALLAYENKRDMVVNVKGIRSGQYQQINQLEESVTRGELDLNVRDRRPGMLMSNQMMAELNLRVGDEVVLVSVDGMHKSLTQFSLPRTYRFEIRGSYSLTQIVDDSPVFIDLEAAQRLFEMNRAVTGMDVGLIQSDQADAVKAKMGRILPDDYKISTWYELQKPLYDVMYLEKWGSYIILMIIVIVAVLNIVGSLTMIVIQKHKDIGVLLTMGYKPSDIKNIFMKQGLYIGLIGCGIGGTAGLFLSWLQKEYGLIKLSSAFIIEAYPASIQLFDVSIVLVGSLLLCLAASWYPAKRASKVEPADAVRYE